MGAGIWVCFALLLTAAFIGLLAIVFSHESGSEPLLPMMGCQILFFSFISSPVGALVGALRSQVGFRGVWGRYALIALAALPLSLGLGLLAFVGYVGANANVGAPSSAYLMHLVFLMVVLAPDAVLVDVAVSGLLRIWNRRSAGPTLEHPERRGGVDSTVKVVASLLVGSGMALLVAIGFLFRSGDGPSKKATSATAVPITEEPSRAEWTFRTEEYGFLATITPWPPRSPTGVTLRVQLTPGASAVEFTGGVSYRIVSAVAEGTRLKPLAWIAMEEVEGHGGKAVFVAPFRPPAIGAEVEFRLEPSGSQWRRISSWRLPDAGGDRPRSVGVRAPPGTRP